MLNKRIKFWAPFFTSVLVFSLACAGGKPEMPPMPITPPPPPEVPPPMPTPKLSVEPVQAATVPEEKKSVLTEKNKEVAVQAAPVEKEEKGGVGKKTYKAKYGLDKPDAEQREVLEKCIAAWGKTPFGNLSQTEIRTIQTKVRVMGIGASEPTDTLATNYPQLVLIHPSTTVMSKTTYKLHNPNGWYCFDTHTTVLGKAVIELDCKAHMANSGDGKVILGSKESNDRGGVVVLGGVKVNRIGCGN